MNQRDIKVSVIMACHNSAAYLDEAVGSILAQTFSNLELIVIDDCSTDNTLQLAQNYQKQDNRVAVIPLSVNSGPAVASNAGIQTASGEWLGILDSDDVAMPERLEQQLHFAGNHPETILVGSGCIEIDREGNVIKRHQYPSTHYALLKRLERSKAFFPHSSAFMSKRQIEQAGNYNTKFIRSQDKALFLRLASIGKMGCLRQPLVKIRKHDQNRSISGEGKFTAIFAFAALVCHFLRIRGYPDPSAGNDDAAWQNFLQWLEKRMIEEGVFAKRKAWADARAEYFATKNRLTGVLRSGGHLLKSGHAGVLVWKKFFGSSLPESLAREWMKRSCAPFQTSGAPVYDHVTN